MQIGYSWKTKIALFLAGVLSVLALFSIMGMAGNTSVGRYQMEVANRDRTHIIYVLDTATGTVKWVDSMGVPFEQLSVD